jgi:hypothetical protein
MANFNQAFRCSSMVICLPSLAELHLQDMYQLLCI